MKNNLLKFAAPLLIATTLLLSAFQNSKETNSSTKLEEAIGQEFVQNLTNQNILTFAKLKPSLKLTDLSDIQKSGTPFELSEEETIQLKQLLLNDSSYIFGMTKKNIFIPEYMISFQNDDALLIDLSNSQVMFNPNKSKTVLDFDPVSEQLQALINHINQSHS